jgi:hypothetical protein
MGSGNISGSSEVFAWYGCHLLETIVILFLFHVTVSYKKLSYVIQA